MNTLMRECTCYTEGLRERNRETENLCVFVCIFIQMCVCECVQFGMRASMMDSQCLLLVNPTGHLTLHYVINGPGVSERDKFMRFLRHRMGIVSEEGK